MFIKTGGKDVVQRMRGSDALKDNEIFCPNCKVRNPDNVKLCSTCGEKLALECKSGATLKQDTNFCGECGKEAQQE